MDIINKRYPSNRLDSYSNIEYLNAGAFGVVFVVIVNRVEKRALKMLAITDTNEREGRILSRLSTLVENGYTHSYIPFYGYYVASVMHTKQAPRILHSETEALYYEMMLADSDFLTFLRQQSASFTLYTLFALTYELIYAFLLARYYFMFSHNDLSIYNLLIKRVTYVRTYTIGTSVMPVRYLFVPIISDFGTSTINERVCTFDNMALATIISDIANYIPDVNIPDVIAEEASTDINTLISFFISPHVYSDQYDNLQHATLYISDIIGKYIYDELFLENEEIVHMPVIFK